MAAKNWHPLDFLEPALAEDSDYVVHIDEDAFLLDPEQLSRLVAEMSRDPELAAAGVPDGGTPYRHHNPYACNLFFAVFKTAVLRETIARRSDWNPCASIRPGPGVSGGSAVRGRRSAGRFRALLSFVLADSRTRLPDPLPVFVLGSRLFGQPSGCRRCTPAYGSPWLASAQMVFARRGPRHGHLARGEISADRDPYECEVHPSSPVAFPFGMRGFSLAGFEGQADETKGGRYATG